jgi:outer membrane protein assembly factor BamB
MRNRLPVVSLIVACLASALPVWAADWPQWRGPFFNGSTDETNLPTSWSATENTAWVFPLPGPSGATPIVWGDKVFVASTVSKSDEFVALCLDADSGQRLWQRTVGIDGRRFPRNNLASPSPVTDGERVFFLYGNGELAGFDLEGRPLWSRNLEKEYGNLALQFGYSNSPLLYGGKLFVIVIRRDKPYRKPDADGPLESFVMALDPASGQTLWKQTRPTNAFDEGMETYSTPLPFVGKGTFQLLNTGADFVTAHDPQAGRELWRFEHWHEKVRDSRVIPSLVSGAGLIFGSRHKNNALFALQPPESGNPARIVWEFDAAAPDCSTPCFYQDRLYVLDGMKHGKVVTCLDAKTGRQFWQGKIGGRGPWRASLTAADGKLYGINETGEVVVLKAGDEAFEILFETKIDERPIQASIAIANRSLYIRTAENLYCIRKK